MPATNVRELRNDNRIGEDLAGTKANYVFAFTSLIKDLRGNMPLWIFISHFANA